MGEIEAVGRSASAAASAGTTGQSLARWHALRPDLCLLLSIMVSDDERDPLATTIHRRTVRPADDFAVPARFANERDIAEVLAEKTNLPPCVSPRRARHAGSALGTPGPRYGAAESRTADQRDAWAPGIRLRVIRCT